MYKRKFLSVAICVFLTVIVNYSMHSNLVWAEWDIQTVDLVGNTGRYTSIAIDSNGNPHISYYDYISKNLKYTKWDGSQWVNADGTGGCEIIDSIGDVGKHTSIYLDKNDYSHISYFDVTNGDLKYAKWTGSSWQKEKVDYSGKVGTYNSIVLDNNDYPHISYHDDTHSDLKYAYWDGVSWSTGIVDKKGATGSESSIALDSNGFPHISYYEDDLWNLKYAKWTGSTWSIKTVDNNKNVGKYTSIVLDRNDIPYISYYDEWNSDLKFTRGSGWTGIETVDSEGDVGRYTSIALDLNDNPYISYYDGTNGDLKFTRWNGSQWVEMDGTPGFEVVDSEGNVGRYTSIAIDNNNNPHISYYDETNEKLKYTKWISKEDTFYIKGCVKNSSRTGINGVILSLSGDVSNTATTGDDGHYEFLNLTSGNYTVTPSKSSWSFDPPSYIYNSLDANKDNQDFIGTKSEVEVINSWIEDEFKGMGTEGIIGYLNTIISKDLIPYDTHCTLHFQLRHPNYFEKVYFEYQDGRKSQTYNLEDLQISRDHYVVPIISGPDISTHGALSKFFFLITLIAKNMGMGLSMTEITPFPTEVAPYREAVLKIVLINEDNEEFSTSVRHLVPTLWSHFIGFYSYTNPDYIPDPISSATMLIVHGDHLIMQVLCPVDLLIIDNKGRKTGSIGSQSFIEIPLSVYSGQDSDPELIWIPNVCERRYSVKIIGKDQGKYTLEIYITGQSIGSLYIVERNVPISYNEVHYKNIMIHSFAKDLKMVKVYPNPCRNPSSTGVTFDNLTSDSLKIRIYNIAGELVKESSVYKEASWVWYGRNNSNNKVASGIYIYLVTNEKGEKKTGKIGLIR